MAFDVNRITLLGRLGQDPKLTKVGKKETPRCTFSIATNRSYKKDDEWQEITTWHNVCVWGNQAETIADRIGKGSRVYIEGYQDHREYTDKNGQERYWSEVVASKTIFLNAPGNNGSAPTDGGGSDNVPF